MRHTRTCNLTFDGKKFTFHLISRAGNDFFQKLMWLWHYSLSPGAFVVLDGGRRSNEWGAAC